MRAALIFGLRAFHFDRARRKAVATYTRMKNADELDVVASLDLVGAGPRSDLRMRATNQPSWLGLHTQVDKRMTDVTLAV
jgi:hypothetical protein